MSSPVAVSPRPGPSESGTACGRRRRQGEQGIALVIVLLVLSLLLAVAGEFAAAMRLEGTTTLNFRAAVTSSFLAEAAYQRAVAEILPDVIAHHLQQPTQASPLVFRRSRLGPLMAPERQDLKLGPGRFSYRITDEDARINLNRASPDQLHRLLQELDVEKQERDVIVDSIQDWRDANEEHRLNGAESDYYLGLPVPYKSKNADFDSVDELLLVRGVTARLFYGTPDQPGLVEYLTVVGTGVLNVNTVSESVLRVFGLAQAEVDQLRQGRPYLDATTIPQTVRSRGQFGVKSTTFRIEAWGEVPRHGRRTVKAIVQRQAGSDGVAKGALRSWQWSADESEQP